MHTPRGCDRYKYFNVQMDRGVSGQMTVAVQGPVVQDLNHRLVLVLEIVTLLSLLHKQ